jgi:membrane associated rhomboid family serine protease
MSITLVIIFVTIIISLIGFGNREFLQRMMFSPYLIYHQKQFYRFISHAFIHAPNNLFHLLFNMFVLYEFGRNVEAYFTGNFPSLGSFYFIFLYFGGVVFSSLRDYSMNKDNPNYLALGASGAVSAVLFSHIVIFPTTSLYLLFIPIPIPSFVFGGLYLWYEQYMDKRGNDHVAHGAHIYGALFGVIFTVFTNFGLVPSFFEQIANYFMSFF